MQIYTSLSGLPTVYVTKKLRESQSHWTLYFILTVITIMPGPSLIKNFLNPIHDDSRLLWCVGHGSQHLTFSTNVRFMWKYFNLWKNYNWTYIMCTAYLNHISHLCEHISTEENKILKHLNSVRPMSLVSQNFLHFLITVFKMD